MKKHFWSILLIGITFNFVGCFAVQLFGNAGNIELRERIYVQTDKQLYLAGEPIRMKFLTTNHEQIPIAFSKIAYAELVADSLARMQIIVELTKGTGEGIMQLPADLPTGYYRLIAYTQYMRNEGSEVFFEKSIAVLNTFQSDYYPVETESKGDELQARSTINNLSNSGTISLQSNKAMYATREHGELMLSGLPDNIHTLSVSIAGKDLIQVTETEQSLFRKRDNVAITQQVSDQMRVLDSLLQILQSTDDHTRDIVVNLEQLTSNELKKISEILTNSTSVSQGNEITVQQMEFLPEYEGHILRGKIIDNQTGEEGGDETFLIPGISFPTTEGIRFFVGQKTETGDVRFFTLGISGAKEVATIVYHADEKYHVDIQSPFVSRFTPKQMPVLRVDSAYYGQLLERSVALQVFHYFSEDPAENRNVSEPYMRMKPSQSYPLDEYTRFTTMREVFTEFIDGARFRRTDGKWGISVLFNRGSYYEYRTMPLVLLDGTPISNHDIIFNYDPLTVEQINIYYGPYTLGGHIFDGIVELITYRRLHADLNLNKATQIISYEGPQLPYRFYTSDYSDEKNRQSRMPDGRHTLLWNPDLQTDGKTSIRLAFDTSDLTGEFQATVEGITKDGKHVFVTSLFKVE